MSKIRPYLTEAVAVKYYVVLHFLTLILVFRLTGCALNLNRLPAAQNNAACLVMKKKKGEHITPLLKYLHWLTVTRCIKYKILLLTFKVSLARAPAYICDMLEL